MSKLFLNEWDTPMSESNGLCFGDVYLDETWTVAPKRPEANCYFRLDYSDYYESRVAVIGDVDITIVRSQLTQLKLALMRAAFLGKWKVKIIFQTKRGGDGMEAVLDRALFGNLASARLDCSIFLDRMEFRKLAELAWNKANVRVQEMERGGHFVADVWKRFVVAKRSTAG